MLTNASTEIEFILERLSAEFHSIHLSVGSPGGIINNCACKSMPTSHAGIRIQGPFVYEVLMSSYWSIFPACDHVTSK